MKKYIGILGIILISLLAGCKNETTSTIIKSEEYVHGQDDQPFYDGFRQVAAGEDGYYFSSGFWMYYFDKETEQMYPLCNKAECSHETDSCTATISGSTAFRYANHKLYYLDNDREDKNKCYLWQMNEDGTNREPLFHIYTEVENIVTQIYIEYFCVHRGYAYYVLLDKDPETKDAAHKVIKRELKKDTKAEIIATYEEKNIEHIHGFGNYIYYYTSIVKEDGVYNDICCYDIQNNDLKILAAELVGVSGITVYDDVIYYVKDNKVWTLNREEAVSKELMEIPEKGAMDLNVNGEYISIDNRAKLFINAAKEDQLGNMEYFKDRCIYIYDKNTLKLVETYRPKDDSDFLLGNGYMVLDFNCGDTYRVLSQDKIGEGDEQWLEFEMCN